MSNAKLIINLTRETVVCDRAVVADRALRRMRGLLGRRTLPPGEGILLRPAPSIHTAFMRFAIDVVFLDRELQVLRVVPALPPWRTASGPRARAVLELAAGEAAARGIAVDDRLGVLELGGAPHAPRWRAGVDHPAEAATAALTPALDASDPLPGQPTVLLIGTDRRFRAVTAVLLSQRGCGVVIGESVDEVPTLAPRHRADVVVLDAGAELGALAQTTTRIRSLVPPIGIVVVVDHAEQPGAVPKWSPFSDLLRAIQQAHAAQPEPRVRYAS